MPGPVQVLLREDVDKLGRAGDVVRVRPGYARNYLLPRGLAVLATKANVQQLELERKRALKRAEQRRKQAEDLAQRLAQVVLRVHKRAGEGGKLYGSVTPAEIARTLKEEGFSVDRKAIVMPEEPIRALGTHEVGVKLNSGVEARVKVEVLPEQD